MKYLVEVKFTNPSHEHISLRRRIETITRIVEAANEDQAILRVTSQQRSLGFFIKEAKIVKEKSHEKEGADETMIAKGKEVMKKAEGKDEEDEEIEEGNGTASYPLLKPGQKLKPMKLKMADKMKEAVDPDKREAGYKMSPAVKAAQAKSDALSKPEKKYQAGTLAAARMKKEEVEQIDERNKQNKYKKDNVVRQIGAHAYIQGVKKTMQSAKIAGREVMKDPKLGSKKVAGLYRKLPNPLTKEEVEQVSEAKVNVNDPKKAKVQIALNKIKSRKMVNMQPTLDTEKK